jgi:chemotaxis protein methyltransferase CheR
MSSLLSRPAQFRHVMFADDLDPRGGAVDLSPVNVRRGRIDAPVGPGRVEAALSGADEAFVGWLLRSGGLSLSDYKPGTMARRLPACLRALRATSIAHARRSIERTPSLLAVALNALVIGVTSFFRDAAVFEQLRGIILPALLDDRPRAAGSASASLRAWSVGCSDGPELYSLAILFAELGALPRAELLGTDCRETAVGRATRGIYTDDEVQPLRNALRERYFVSDGADRWRASDALRRASRFRVGNALEQAEPGPFDLILCRNMAIYFHPEAAGRLWQRLQEALRPGGVLVLGKAETPVGAGKLAQVAPGMFRRSRG